MNNSDPLDCDTVDEINKSAINQAIKTDDQH